jgi:hypothetical protein
MKPLTKIVGRPTIRDRNNLVDELCELAVSNDINFKWAIAADGTNYGALAEVMATAAYTTLTGQTWVNETLPAAFDSGITAATTAYNASKRSAEHEDKRYAFATLVGMRKGLTENIRDALEPQYYQQLKARTIGYKKVTVKQHGTNRNSTSRSSAGFSKRSKNCSRTPASPSTTRRSYSTSSSR